MSSPLETKVLVVGGGPGGYVAAIRAGQLGLETVLVDEGRLGGTCLIRGCIPSKALIHVAGLFEEMVQAAEAPRFGISLAAGPRLDLPATMRWKDGMVDKLSAGVAGLLKRARVRVITGKAIFSDAKTCRVGGGASDTLIVAEHVVLATGSIPVELRTLPFGGNVLSSTDALALRALPGRLVVVGAGYIGLELGGAFARLGSQVSIVEAQDRILPIYDARLVEPVSRGLRQAGVSVHLGAKAVSASADGLVIESTGGERSTLPADSILVTIGRRPNIHGWGLEEMGLAMERGFVKVDDRCATSTAGVWAIGDLVGEPMLAHKASAQGEMVAEILSGRRRRFDPRAIPAVCYTDPEVATVGLAPGEVPETVEAIVGEFPFQANGRALSMDAGGGFVRVVARKDDHRILGIQAVGKHISELAGEFGALLEMGAVLEDVAGIIHAHPTLGEAFHESALKALGHAVHI